MLRASRYNFELSLEDGRLVLYNAKTGALVMVEPSQSGVVSRVLRGFAQEGNQELLGQMTEQGFLFDDSPFQFNKRNELMEPWVYDAVYRFLENLVKNTRDEVHLRLSWFGGEPTLALRKIEEFQIRLKKLEDRYGLETLGAMVTNGYLLTKEWVKKLVQLGVTQFQVTIDGAKRAIKRPGPRFRLDNGGLGSCLLPCHFQFNELNSRVKYL